MTLAQQQLESLFSQDVCVRATKPLREGVQIAVTLGDEATVSLRKAKGRLLVSPEKPLSPDLSFVIPLQALDELSQLRTEDISEVGISILKLMLHRETNFRITAKVHIGPLTLLRNGYFNVLALGGPSVMKFLASKGLTNLGKIKDAIGRMKA